jgi:nitroimidazol reductase NimA-like FMN-containing flavoprotein (pyridoxamine 5'-phosphate oxidase superfamily)
MSLVMTQAECEAFLAELHVAIISVAEEGRGPLTVPIWYNYEPGGEIKLWTGGNARKVKLMRQAGRFSLCVQKETRPYKYVSVEGPVVAIEPIDLERDLRPLVYRYLGPEEGQRYLDSLGGPTAGTGDLVICMRPERWNSLDFAKRTQS